MATIHNTDLTKELKDGGRLQQLKDVIPSQLADKVVPVMEVNPKLLRNLEIRDATATNATSATILTTPATGQDVYLIGASLSMIKDATATSTASRVVLATDAGSYSILNIAGLTLTAQSETMTIALPRPIKLARNTTVTVRNSTNVGNVTSIGAIFYYVVDNPNA